MSSMGMHTLQVCSASRKTEFGCVPSVPPNPSIEQASKRLIGTLLDAAHGQH